MDREDKRGIFFGVIGVLTLIVAIIGASLAYFSINAKSNDDALTVQAATVQIVYKDGEALNVNEIIPSTKAIALETYRRFLAGDTYKADLGEGETDVPYQKCVDDKGHTVCGVYEFTLTNNGVNPVNVTAKVVPTVLEEGQIQFKNLKFSLYDITSVTESNKFGTEVTIDGSVSYTEFNLLSAPVSIGSKKTTKYRLFVWLDEQHGPQDDEQGASFKGTIYVNVPGAESTITGNADQTIGE